MGLERWLASSIRTAVVFCRGLVPEAVAILRRVVALFKLPTAFWSRYGVVEYGNHLEDCEDILPYRSGNDHWAVLASGPSGGLRRTGSSSRQG